MQPNWKGWAANVRARVQVENVGLGIKIGSTAVQTAAFLLASPNLDDELFMLARLKHRWRAFKRLEPGKRFQTQYREHRESEAGRSPVRRVLYALAGVVAFVVGVVLVFVPGPAVLFFLIAGGLFAVQSLWVARALDWSELRARAAVKAIRNVWHPGARRVP